MKYGLSYMPFTDKELNKKINILTKDVNLLKTLRMLTNEILSNSAYHEKNIEQQFKQFEKLNVLQEEKDIIASAWMIKNKIANKALLELKELCNELEKKGYV